MILQVFTNFRLPKDAINITEVADEDSLHVLGTEVMEEETVTSGHDVANMVVIHFLQYTELRKSDSFLPENGLGT